MIEKMGILKIFADQNNWIMFSKPIARKLGIIEAIILGDLISKENYFEKKNELDSEGFFYNTHEDIEKSTTIKRDRQIQAIQTLVDYGLIKKVLKGVPRKAYYKVDEDKISEWIQNSELQSSEISTTRQRKFRPQEVENSDSKFNKNKFNKNKKEELRDEKSLKPPTKQILHSDIYKIFKIILPIGEFPHILPETEEENVSKLLIKAQTFIECLLNGDISKTYEWDKKWLSTTLKDGFPYPKDQKEILSMLKKACSRFATMKKEGYWPENKKPLPKSIDDFFYNSRTHKSWFFYCLKNQPKEMNTVVGDKIQEQTLKQISDERDRQAAIEYKKPSWNASTYWHKILELHEWIQKYGPVLYAYNQEGPTSIYFLLEEIKEFQSTWTEWSLSNFGYGNKTWSLFVKWMKEKKNIDLDPDKDLLRTKLSEFGWTEKEMEKLK